MQVVETLESQQKGMFEGPAAFLFPHFPEFELLAQQLVEGAPDQMLAWREQPPSAPSIDGEEEDSWGAPGVLYLAVIAAPGTSDERVMFMRATMAGSSLPKPVTRVRAERIICVQERGQEGTRGTDRRVSQALWGTSSAQGTCNLLLALLAVESHHDGVLRPP